MEDRTPGQPGSLFQTAYGRTLVAVARETGPRPVEDLAAARVEMVLAHPGHRTMVSAKPAGSNPYVRIGYHSQGP
ncbi:hypothetical protein [Alloactinosynnema sp. L-07]|nr:hypothetical protein [Alloactinosynnema sp. L-07]